MFQRANWNGNKKKKTGGVVLNIDSVGEMSKS